MNSLTCLLGPRATLGLKWCCSAARLDCLFQPARHFASRDSTEQEPIPHKVPRLTSERHPDIQRFSKFKKLSQGDIDYLSSLCPSIGIHNASDDDLVPYNTDWMNKYRGNSRLILKPKSTLQVSQILRYCNDQSLAIVPQGGNTGLVGGSVPVFDEIVLALSNMNKIRQFDPISGIVTAEAGCILQDLDEYLKSQNYMMPLDLGAKGSCQIGGNVATNAGGLRLLRYGSLHGSVLGVEVVLPNGEILDALSALRKDNTGLHLKHLFIGSEGTLGVITAVTVLTPLHPNCVNVALLSVPTYNHVQQVYIEARKQLGEILSAFEFWDESATNLVRKHLNLCVPLEKQAPFSILIETSGSNAQHDMEKLEAFLESLLGTHVSDGALAQDQSQAAAMWSIRESIPEASAREGAVYKYDVSMPVPHLYSIVEEMRLKLENIKQVKTVIGYGHVGDGNLHLNVSADDYSSTVEDALEPHVYELVARHKGSISAEHGLGLMKPQFLHYSKSKSMIDQMHQIKRLFDPKGIMNPYKYLPNITS